MKCSIIGANGFVGGHLLRTLRQQGHDVSGYDIEACEEAGVQRLNVCSDQTSLPTGVDVVIYLSQSPYYRVFPERADDLYGVNVIGAARLAAAAKVAGASLFVYASTGNVYQVSYKALAESHPVRRDDAYALSKVMGEDAVAAVAGEMRTLSLRIFGAFGPGQQNMLIPGLIGRIRQHQAITLQPHPISNHDGGLIVSLIYINDLVNGLQALIDGCLHGEVKDQIINLGGPRGVSIREIAVGLGEALGEEPIFELGEVVRPFDLIADVTRLRSLTEMSFTSLTQSLQETVCSYE